MSSEKEMLDTIASAFCAIRNAYEYEAMVRLGATERAVKASMEILAWKQKAWRILKDHGIKENETLKCD